MNGGVSFFQDLYDQIATRGFELVGWPSRSEQGETLCASLARALLAQKGEASAAALAQRLVEVCRGLDDEARFGFFAFLAENFSPDPAAALAAAKAYAKEPGPATLAALQAVVEPPRQDLFRRMNMAADGTATLVSLRASLIDMLGAHPRLRTVDHDLLHLFISWFNRGFLMFDRVDWHSSAALLEKLIAYEAVHRFTGWHDLRRRLGPDRRCFAFFHPALPDEPLIFVQVALTRGIADRIAPLIDPERDDDDPAKADTAIFYSITNCQKGLRGVSFGSFLIKQVAAELKAELPHLQTFATLSPVPGFRRWLEAQTHPPEGLVETLAEDGWHEDPEKVRAWEKPLAGLCAHYLTRAKRPDGYPLDPVARFHLGNGARLERVDPLGDLSTNGMRLSAGTMVNYLYRLDHLEQNHEAYVNDKSVIATRAVETLARRAPLQAAAADDPPTRRTTKKEQTP